MLRSLRLVKNSVPLGVVRRQASTEEREYSSTMDSVEASSSSSQGVGTRLPRVYADGVFDLFHLGHMTYLSNVRKAFAPQKIHLIIGVCSDEDTESYKRLPVMDFDTRIKTVAMSGLGDEVIQAPLKATPDFVAQHDIDFVCHGSDWTDEMVEEYYGDMHRMGKLKIVPHTPGISTTDIIKRIKARNDIP